MCDFLVAKLSLIVLQMGRNFTQGALVGSFTFLERTSWLQFANARWSKLFYFGSWSIFLAFIAIVIWPSVVLYNEETSCSFEHFLLVFLCCSPEFYLSNSWRMDGCWSSPGCCKVVDQNPSLLQLVSAVNNAHKLMSGKQRRPWFFTLVCSVNATDM